MGRNELKKKQCNRFRVAPVLESLNAVAARSHVLLKVDDIKDWSDEVGLKLKSSKAFLQIELKRSRIARSAQRDYTSNARNG